MEPLSAIVVLIEHNVYSVYIVPANVASTENMNALRALRNSILQKYGRQDYITLQRVLKGALSYLPGFLYRINRSLFVFCCILSP